MELAGKRETGTEAAYETIMTENFQNQCQTIKHGSKKLTEQQARYMPKQNNTKTTPRLFIFNLQIIKDKHKILKDTRGKKIPTYSGQ